MDSTQVEQLRSINPAQLGDRIRACRVSKGVTQGDLAEGLISVGYVSRIETGARRPNAKVLEGIADKLDVPLEQFLLGISPRMYDEIRLGLDYAELSLESGSPIEAESKAREALNSARSGGQSELVQRGRFLLGRALEAQGRLREALPVLHEVATGDDCNLLEIRAGIALARCYRDSGDLAKSIDVGEDILAQVNGTPLRDTDEAVQLAVTVAAAYFMRGDAQEAVRICNTAIAQAEQMDSSAARASAYWNASVFESEQGSIERAIPLAQRALALMSEGKDARNLALVRSQLGLMQLRMDPPQFDEAHTNLTKAASELAWTSAGAYDTATNQISLAKSHLLRGDLDEALALAGPVAITIAETSPYLAAEAKVVEGQTFLARNMVNEARAAAAGAADLLAQDDGNRWSAQLWFELAQLFEDAGDVQRALNSYRTAAKATGLAKPQAETAPRALTSA
ncbi:MAG: helix-turn-helix domain-containing protein [Mycobacterium sp.]